MVELGQIEKPTVESFAGKRKLYCLPNIYPVDDAPDEYKDLFNKYWDEVAEQIEKLEAVGRIKKIFCENIFLKGEEALDVLAKINDRALQIVRKKIEQGAVLLPVESEEIFPLFWIGGTV